MKAEFLKLAGVKSEKAFYKKYPTEAAFFKAHPEAKKSVKKAQYGGVMSGMSDYLQSMNNVPNMQNMMQGQMQSPGVNAGMFNGPQVDNSVSTIDASTLADDKSGYAFAGGPNTKMDKLNNLGNQLGTYAPMAGQLISGYQNLRAGRRARKEAEKWAKVTDVQARASETEDVDDRRQYVDNARKRRNALMPVTTGEEFFPIYGVGSNVLAKNGVTLQDGGMIGGNPTEIQNTYEGGTDIYTDLEYEPLYNVDQVKSYQSGGKLHQMQNGGYSNSQDYYNQIINAGKSTGIISGGDVAGGGTPWGAIGGIGSSVAGNLTGNDGGGQIGGAIGGAAGMALGGPMGAAIGSTLGTAVGGLLDTNDRDRKKAEQTTKWNTNRMIASQYRESLQQGPFGSYMKDGGYVSNDWTPQVIAKFGELDAQDYAEFAHKDEFRAGGHLKSYTPPSERAMETAQRGYTVTKSPNLIDLRDTRTIYDPYLHKDVPVYTTPSEYRMGLRAATASSSNYNPREEDLDVVQMDNLRDYNMLTQESNDDYTFPIGDANERAATAAKYFDRTGKLPYRVESGDYKNITPETEKTLSRIWKGQVRKNGGPINSYAMGGELETHWGGYAEPMSYNPYLPGTGETVMFRGKSHEEYSPNGETGIGITYGGNPVEVERGEPMVELEEGGVIDPETGEVQKSGVVFGNLQIPNQYIDLLGDPKAKGKKFKNYVTDLSKTELKQNKLIDKSTDELDRLDVKNSFDKLKLSSLEANIKGGNMKLKSIADKKVKAADLQSAINDTAEEYGLIADDLAKGKVKQDKEAMKAQAKYGATIDKFQGGGFKTKGTGDKWSFTQAGETGNPLFDDMQRYQSEWVPSVNTALSDKERAAKMLKYIETYSGEGSTNIKKALNKIPTEEGKIMFLQQQGTNKQVGPIHNVLDAAIKYTAPGMTTPLKENPKVENKVDNQFETVPYKRSGLLDVFGQVLPYIRPTDQEGLNPNQLMGEMYAMSTNQLEPVQATPYTPQLRVPYDISRQAAKNDLIAQTRAAQRMAQGNPEMQAAIAAQAYNPMQQLNEQDFIDNQRMKDAVYSGNIATLNDAELKNLAIYDQQYQRQEQAKSNTKATAQAVLNSISDKYAKNALENRTLGVYENLYNYRYDKMGRAINMNAPFQPNIPYIYGADGKITHKIIKDANGKIIGYQPIAKGEAVTEQTTTPIPSLSTGPIVQQGSVAPVGYVPIDSIPADEEEYTNQEYIDQVAPKKFGGKVNKKYSQSSIVRSFK